MDASGRKQLLIVAHAPSPNTERLRAAAHAGAKSIDAPSVCVESRSPFDVQPQDVLGAGAILLGTTENLGYMSGALKDFFDRIYYPCLEHTQGLAFAAYIRAGHDGTGTRRAIETITTGLRWKAVQAPLVCRGAFDEAFVDQVYELGAAMSAGLDMGIL